MRLRPADSKSALCTLYGGKISSVDLGRSGAWDESDDSTTPTGASQPEGWFDSPPSEDIDAWVTGEQLAEILSLELAFERCDPSCPRCGSWLFTYGVLQFCSHGCVENMTITKGSD